MQPPLRMCGLGSSNPVDRYTCTDLPIYTGHLSLDRGANFGFRPQPRLFDATDVDSKPSMRGFESGMPPTHTHVCSMRRTWAQNLRCEVFESGIVPARNHVCSMRRTWTQNLRCEVSRVELCLPATTSVLCDGRGLKTFDARFRERDASFPQPRLFDATDVGSKPSMRGFREWNCACPQPRLFDATDVGSKPST